MMVRVAAALAIALFAGSGVSARPAIAQEVPFENRIAEGERIRFVAPPLFPDSTIGVFASLDLHLMYVDSLFAGSDPVAIPLVNLSMLEVSRGRDPKTLTGLGIGAAVGVLAGILLTAAFCSDPDSGNCEFDETLLTTLIIAVPFAGLGAMIGSMARPERWEEIPLP